MNVQQLRCLPDLRRFESNNVALAALLNLSSFFDMPKARTHAIRSLETLPTFTAVRRFQLGMRNDLREWVPVSFRQIVPSVPVELLTEQDVHGAGRRRNRHPRILGDHASKVSPPGAPSLAGILASGPGRIDVLQAAVFVRKRLGEGMVERVCEACPSSRSGVEEDSNAGAG